MQYMFDPVGHMGTLGIFDIADLVVNIPPHSSNLNQKLTAAPNTPQPCLSYTDLWIKSKIF